MSVPEQKLILSGGELSDYFARLTVKSLFVLLVVLVLATVQMLRYGLDTRYLVLVGGAIFSLSAMFGLMILIMLDKGNKRRGIVPMAIALSGFIPYLFGCYLFLFEGFYRFKALFYQFTWMTIIVAILYIISGWTVVNGIYLLSKFARLVDEGVIIVER